MKPNQIRQGDVQLEPVSKLPAGCTEIPNDKGRIVLAYGEVTGHAHAIADHIMRAPAQTLMDRAIDATDQAEEAIARAKAKARLWQAPDGIRYLEVTEQVTLRHEEHTAHSIDPGIYKLPVQVEYTPAELRRVED